MSIQSADRAISCALAAELGDRTAWGDPPCLYTIHVRGSLCRLRPVPVPLASWPAGAPDILAAIGCTTRIAARLAGALSLPGLYGTALRFEGQALDTPDLGAGLRGQARAGTRAHRIHAPGREEFRILLAADRTGTTYAARQQRGDERVYSRIVPPSPQLRPDGALPAALRRLTMALAGARSPSTPQSPRPGPDCPRRSLTAQYRQPDTLGVLRLFAGGGPISGGRPLRSGRRRGSR